MPERRYTVTGAMALHGVTGGRARYLLGEAGPKAAESSGHILGIGSPIAGILKNSLFSGEIVGIGALPVAIEAPHEVSGSIAGVGAPVAEGFANSLNRLTEDSDHRITEDGDRRVLEHG